MDVDITYTAREDLEMTTKLTTLEDPQSDFSVFWSFTTRALLGRSGCIENCDAIGYYNIKEFRDEKLYKNKYSHHIKYFRKKY